MRVEMKIEVEKQTKGLFVEKTVSFNNLHIKLHCTEEEQEILSGLLITGAPLLKVPKLHLRDKMKDPLMEYPEHYDDLYEPTVSDAIKGLTLQFITLQLAQKHMLELKPKFEYIKEQADAFKNAPMEQSYEL